RVPTLAPERAYAAEQVVNEKPPRGKKQPQLEIHQLEMHRWTREVGDSGQPITAKEMVIHEGKHRMEMGWKKLTGSNNDKEERSALAEIEADLKRMKDLLQLLNKVDEKSGEEPPADPVIADRLGFAGNLVKIRLRKTLTRDEAIPIFKNYIALAAKKV